MAKSPAWQRKEGKAESGGLNAKGRASYNRANPGKPGLKPPQPEGLKAAAARRGVAPRLLLCADEGDEEEVNFDQDCKRSK